MIIKLYSYFDKHHNVTDEIMDFFDNNDIENIKKLSSDCLLLEEIKISDNLNNDEITLIIMGMLYRQILDQNYLWDFNPNQDWYGYCYEFIEG